MKIYYSESELIPLSALNAVDESKRIQNIFFKCHYNGYNLYSSYVFHPNLEKIGYSEFLNDLKNEIPSTLITNFQKEFELKKQNIILSENLNFNFEDLLAEDKIINKNPKYHYTLNSLKSVSESLGLVEKKIKTGFTRFKFKVDQKSIADFYEYIKFLKLHDGIEFIFDFNSSANMDLLLNLEINYQILKRIFWEDPVPYHFDDWNILKNNGFQLILDQKSMVYGAGRLTPNINLGRKNKQYPFKIVSIKPTKESIADFLLDYPNFKYLITTNMGDELDHRISAFWANEVQKLYPKSFFGAGLYTRHFFKDWKAANGIDFFSESSGWGLDQVMEQKKWIDLGEYYFEL